MIRDALIALALSLCASVSWAQEADAPASAPAADVPLEDHRSVFDALAERAIGLTSKRLRFDWRKGTIQAAMLGGLPAELNNFESLRTGAVLRFPTGSLLLSLGVNYVWVSGTPSTEDLSMTPYRQAARPSRWELDFGLDWPLAEGIVTPLPRILPAAQLTLTLHAQLRYLIYPGGMEGLGVKDTLKALIAGRLTDAELDNLESQRMPGMTLDPGRYVALVGIGDDLYFRSGFFFSHRVLVATPLLQFMSETQLPFGFEWDLLFGYAF